MVTIWAPGLIREATNCRVWPARGPPGPPGTVLGMVWVLSWSGPGATELPAAGRVEGLVEDLRRPRLADGGQVDRRFQN
jgi:hypothetical protein